MYKTTKAILVLSMFVVIGGTLSVLLGQDSNFDLQNYHLYNAYSFLHNRLWWDLAPANVQTFYNPILDVPYYIMLLVFPRSEIFAAFVMGTYYGLGVFLLWKAATELFRNIPHQTIYAALATAVGTTGAAGLSQLGATFNEWQVAVLYLASVAAVLTWIDDARPQFWRVLLCGALTGLAAGCKLTAVPFGVAAFGSAVVVQETSVQRLRVAVIFCLGIIIGFAITGGAWCWIMYSNFGNPVFPYFNGLFHSPWADPVSIRDERFLPHGLLESLTYPFHWALSRSTRVSELYIRDPRLAIVLSIIYILFGVTLCTVICKLRNSKHYFIGIDAPIPRRWKYILLLFITSYFLWQFLFSVYRYVIPLEAISGIIIVGASYHFLNKITSIRLVQLGAVAMFGIGIILITVSPDWGHVTFQSGSPGVSVPELPRESLVIVSKAGPLSFVIPFFQQDMRFVRGIYSARDKNQYNKLIDELIGRHAGPLLFLEYAQVSSEEDEQQLQQLRLIKVEAECVPLKSQLTPVGIQICPLRRK